MPLESTIICVDNSEFMRNGDYMPNRLQAQQDAVNTVCRSKLLANPENNVGLLTLANTEVLVTLTTDGAKILTSLHRVQPDGFINLLTGIRIAHLSLKHRQSKNHKMRIVVFVGSPIAVEEKEVVKMAKRLKKENVSLDVINFGETDENKVVLEALVNTLNGREGTGSHLVTVPPSPHLADALLSSPIVQGEDGQGPANFSAGGGFEFGVDPNEDPELALALRVSMEEQRQRQQEEERRTAAANGETPATPMEVGEPAAVEKAEDKEDESAPMEQGPSEEEMLQQALAMSLEAGAEEPEAGGTPEIKKKVPAADNFPDFTAMTEEEQIAYAMQISMQGSKEDEESMGVDPPKKKKKAEAEKSSVDTAETDFSAVMSDAAFLQNVLQSLPGVDPNSQLVQDAVGSLAQDKDKKKKKETKETKEKKEEEDKDKK